VLLTYLYLVPLLGVTATEYRRDIWHQKTRVQLHRVSYSIVCVILCFAILVQYRHATDEWTHEDIIYHASIVMRKNV